MHATISLEEAQTRLPELVANLARGEELLIVNKGRTVAKLVGESQEERQPRQPGLLKHMISSMSDDFDAPLEDFKEYME